MKGSSDPGATCHHLCESQFREVDEMGKMLQYNQYRFCENQIYDQRNAGIRLKGIIQLLPTLGTAYLIYKYLRFLHKKQIFKLHLSVYFYQQWIKFAKQKCHQL